MHLINWSLAALSTSIKCLSVLTQCRGGQTSAMINVKQLLVPINLGGVIRSFQKLFEVHQSIVRKIIDKWKNMSIVKLSILPGGDDPASATQPAKKQTATSKTLQALVSMSNVKVHDGTFRKRLNKNGLFGRVAGKRLKNNITEARCCNGPVKAPTSSWLKCCGGTLSELCMNNDRPLNELNQWSKVQSGPKFPHNVRLIKSYRKQWLEVTAVKSGSKSCGICSLLSFSHIFSVNLHVTPVHRLVLSWYPGYLPQSRSMHFN